MIEWKTGDIFNTSCKTIVNTVNCEGVMGKGIALECKKRYPFMFKVYQYACAYGPKGTQNNPILKEGGDLYFYWNPKAEQNELWLSYENELEKIHPGISINEAYNNLIIDKEIPSENPEDPVKLIFDNTEQELRVSGTVVDNGSGIKQISYGLKDKNLKQIDYIH